MEFSPVLWRRRRRSERKSAVRATVSGSGRGGRSLGRLVSKEDVVTGLRVENVKRVLVEHGLSPYSRLTDRANCGGRGLCATCGVRLRSGPEADHWHDRLAARFGYPRLSCQVAVEPGMIVELVDEKLVWGPREAE